MTIKKASKKIQTTTTLRTMSMIPPKEGRCLPKGFLPDGTQTCLARRIYSTFTVQRNRVLFFKVY